MIAADASVEVVGLSHDCACLFLMTSTYLAIKREVAQGLVEYGLILALVALLAVASLLLFRPALPSLLSLLAASI